MTQASLSRRLSAPPGGGPKFDGSLETAADSALPDTGHAFLDTCAARIFKAAEVVLSEARDARLRTAAASLEAESQAKVAAAARSSAPANSFRFGKATASAPITPAADTTAHPFSTSSTDPQLLSMAGLSLNPFTFGGSTSPSPITFATTANEGPELPNIEEGVQSHRSGNAAPQFPGFAAPPTQDAVQAGTGGNFTFGRSSTGVISSDGAAVCGDGAAAGSSTRAKKLWTRCGNCFTEIQDPTEMTSEAVDALNHIEL